MFHGWMLRPRQRALESDSLEPGDRPFVSDVSRIQSRFWFDEHDMGFIVGDGEMFNAARDDDEFALTHERFVAAEFHAQRAFDDEKELVFMFVVVPDKFTLQLHRLDVAFIHLADNPGVPVIGEETEFFAEIYGFHRVT
jgi:hypothetical protein